ncbi:protein arginine kinase [Kamptonema cortianum]|nr:protein arginine kinase [Kamptonema cortianum]MDL5049742.1 protein arginine kinase [Oscillatoria amoena NRMC-F 0135]
MKQSKTLKSQLEDPVFKESAKRIVMSSRIRLARNLRGLPFPGWAKKADRIKVLETVQPEVSALPEMKGAKVSNSMDQYTALEKQLLVEKHLVSREHAAKNVGSGIVINKDETLSIMINEEDHMRIQAINHGFNLTRTWNVIDKVDDELNDKLDFAFSPKIGFLTACPTNVGTGMRASVMLHLPGLVLSEQINQIIQAVNKLGLAVRGLYGEGTEASGNLFQISNQTTLGETETGIIERLAKVVAQIIEHEDNARGTLLENKVAMVNDQVGRSYGILTNAHTMTSKEATNLLSIMKMGVDMGMFSGEIRPLIDDLFIATQPAHLQKAESRKLGAEERDILRAEIIREKLLSTPPPKVHKLSQQETIQEGE